MWYISGAGVHTPRSIESFSYIYYITAFRFTCLTIYIIAVPQVGISGIIHNIRVCQLNLSYIKCLEALCNLQQPLALPRKKEQPRALCFLSNYNKSLCFHSSFMDSSTTATFSYISKSSILSFLCQ